MYRTGGADFQADAIIVNGTNGNESIRVAGEAFGASVLGLAAQVNITCRKGGPRTKLPGARLFSALPRPTSSSSFSESCGKAVANLWHGCLSRHELPRAVVCRWAGRSAAVGRSETGFGLRHWRFP